MNRIGLATPTLKLMAALMCLVLVLAACGNGDGSSNDGDGHQFATDRQPTQVPATETPTQQIVPPTSAPTQSPASLFELRGAPRVAYLMLEGDLVSYDSMERRFTRVEVPDDTAVIDFAASPTGDRVGVLGTVDNHLVVQFFGSNGEPLGDAFSLRIPAPGTPSATPQASPIATPVAAIGEPVYVVNWVPQGNAVVVSGPGVIYQVSMNGSIMPGSRTGVEGTVREALWSPMDSEIAILSQLGNGEQSVYLIEEGEARAIELNAFHDHSGQAISNLQWLPSGRGMILVAGENRDGYLMNGQLFTYKFGDDVPVLIASSAQGGPSATISHAAVSPDGHSVAYVVMVRDADSWNLHSFWVRPTRGGPAVQIPTSSGSPVVMLQWTAEGLIWQQEDGSAYVVDGSLQPRPLGTEPVATPAATPVATPVATPEISLTPAG